MNIRHAFTTIFGSLAGAAILLHQLGISIGHIGNTDFVTLVGAGATVALGIAAGDAAQMNKNTTAVANLIENQNGGTLRKLNPDGTPAPRDPVAVIQEK
jgi:hypothetical protein